MTTKNTAPKMDATGRNTGNKAGSSKSVAVSLETVNKAVGSFRAHGQTAVKYWNDEIQAAGMGDCYAALAMAEYMQEADNIIALEYSRKKDEKTGKPSLLRQLPFKLSEVDAVKARADVKQDAAAAINKAIVFTVFGIREPNPDYMAKLKTRISRAYPAALALLFRAKELGIKLADVVTINADGKITVADAVTKRVPTKAVTIEGKKVEGKPAPQQIAESKPVVLSVADMAAKAKEWHVANKAAPTGGNTGARVQSNGGGKSAEEKAAEAKALAKTSFLAATRTVQLRLNAIMTDDKNGNTLGQEETDALAVLAEVMGKYEKYKAHKVRMAAADNGEEVKEEQPAPKAKRTRKSA